MGIDPIGDEHKSTVHYSRKELSAFRKAVKDLSRNERSRSHQCAVHADPRDCSRCTNTDLSLRGLEQYLCYPRARNKAMALKGVLKWHRKLEARAVGTDAERAGSLALCASRLNSWSRQVALETARQACLLACKLTRGESRRVPVDEDEESE